MRKKKSRAPTANKRSNPMPPMPSSSLYSSHSHSLPSPRPFIASHYKKVYFFISIFALSVTTFFLSSISSNTFPTIRSLPKPAQLYTIQVVNEFPHDPHAFTQGLLYGGNDTLFESTGLYHQSSVRRVVIQTGKIVALQQMDSSYFGEGLTLYNERLYQVTWLKNTGFMYDRNNLSKFEKFTHEMKDGWGLATDGRVLFGTDGSSTLYHIDPQSLKVLQKQVVKYKGREVFNLNELEYVNDEVWANVWQTDCIAKISPEDGVVREWILLHNLRDGLFASGEKNFDVLNGIAWDKEKDRIFVTGKLWPKLYEIKLQPTRNQLYGAIEDICMPMPFIFPKA